MLFLKELFYASSIAIIIFSLMETLQPGLVLAYINLNYVLLFWLLIGIVILVFEDRRKKLQNFEKS